MAWEDTCRGFNIIAVASPFCFQVGHEDWVMSVAWRPALEQSNGEEAGPCLLSASMDRSMMLWAPCGGGMPWYFG